MRLDRDLPPDLAGRAELGAAETGRVHAERAQDGRDGATRALVPPAPPDADVRERDFLALVVDLARAFDWLVYHTHDARRSPEGFPDLVLVRDGRLVVAELKTRRGRVSGAQALWGVYLGRCAGVTYRLWRPESWPEIVAVLTEPVW